MFEKEADEYRTRFENELYLFGNTDIFPNDIEEAYQKGATDGYNKANEWHYEKSEEDLPKDNSEYLLLLEHGIRVFGYYNGKWWESWKGDLSWQEVKAYFFIPVPELPKESE